MGRFCFDIAFCSLVCLFLAIYSVDGYSISRGGSGSQESTKGSGGSSTGGSHEQHAPSPQPCDSHPCQHGGICHNHGTTYECVCPSGCSGARCELENKLLDTIKGATGSGPSSSSSQTYPDHVNSKSNSGSNEVPALGDTQNPTKSASKESRPSSSGSSSHTDPDHVNSKPSSESNEVPAPNPQPCDSHPCQHGGVCQNKGQLFECVCPSGCSGRRCENGPVQDPCANNPCEHGGACSPYGSSYRCSCPSAYMGSRCQLGKTQNPTKSASKESGHSSHGSSSHKDPDHVNPKSNSGSNEVPALGDTQNPTKSASKENRPSSPGSSSHTDPDHVNS
nr:sea star footprint protein 4b [Asterias rubens]